MRVARLRTPRHSTPIRTFGRNASRASRLPGRLNYTEREDCRERLAMPAADSPLVVLESGDRLTRAEFHRRYCARPDIKKAELIQRVVYVASPTRGRLHGGPHGAVATWLGVYAASTPGAQMMNNATVYLGHDSEVQPDAFLFREPPEGGWRPPDRGRLRRGCATTRRRDRCQQRVLRSA